MFCNLFYIVLQLFVEFGVAWKNLDVDDDRTKACFSKHSQWPPKSLALAGLESLCCFV